MLNSKLNSQGLVYNQVQHLGWSLFAKTVYNFQSLAFLEKHPPLWMFDRVLNKPLVHYMHHAK